MSNCGEITTENDCTANFCNWDLDRTPNCYPALGDETEEDSPQVPDENSQGLTEDAAVANFIDKLVEEIKSGNVEDAMKSIKERFNPSNAAEEAFSSSIASGRQAVEICSSGGCASGNLAALAMAVPVLEVIGAAALPSEGGEQDAITSQIEGASNDEELKEIAEQLETLMNQRLANVSGSGNEEVANAPSEEIVPANIGHGVLGGTTISLFIIGRFVGNASISVLTISFNSIVFLIKKLFQLLWLSGVTIPYNTIIVLFRILHILMRIVIAIGGPLVRVVLKSIYWIGYLLWNTLLVTLTAAKYILRGTLTGTLAVLSGTVTLLSTIYNLLMSLFRTKNTPTQRIRQRGNEVSGLIADTAGWLGGPGVTEEQAAVGRSQTRGSVFMPMGRGGTGKRRKGRKHTRRRNKRITSKNSKRRNKRSIRSKR